jgi:hypothetical protein
VPSAQSGEAVIVLTLSDVPAAPPPPPPTPPTTPPTAALPSLVRMGGGLDSPADVSLLRSCDEEDEAASAPLPFAAELPVPPLPRAVVTTLDAAAEPPWPTTTVRGDLWGVAPALETAGGCSEGAWAVAARRSVRDRNSSSAVGRWSGSGVTQRRTRRRTWEA